MTDDSERAGLWAYAVELSIMLLIVSRLAQVGEGVTYAVVSAWLAGDMAKIDEILGSGLTSILKLSARMFRGIASSSDAWAKPLYAYRRMPQPKVAKDPALSAILEGGRKAADDRTRQYVHSSVLNLVYENPVTGETRLMPIKAAYRRMIEDQLQAFGRGEVDYNAAIGTVVDNLGSHGLRVQYESGRTRELYAAVQLNFRDAYRQTMQDVRTAQGAQFGADGVEIDAHGMCAADHLPYQGHQYRMAEFDEIQAGLKRPIGQGYNCRHMATPIIYGVSTKAYTPDELRRYREQSTREVMVGDKSMTAYEFTQWQRRQELAVRKLRGNAKLARAAGDDALGSRLDKRAETIKANYRRLSKANGIDTREERMRVPRVV